MLPGLQRWNESSSKEGCQADGADVVEELGQRILEMVPVCHRQSMLIEIPSNMQNTQMPCIIEITPREHAARIVRIFNGCTQASLEKAQGLLFLGSVFEACKRCSEGCPTLQ